MRKGFLSALEQREKQDTVRTTIRIEDATIIVLVTIDERTTLTYDG